LLEANLPRHGGAVPGTNPSALESNSRWAAVLSAVGGFVDAAGFLVILGLFTAHMSGNSTGLGVALATGHWGEALRRGFVIPVFVGFTAAGVAWIEASSPIGSPTQSRERVLAQVLTVEIVFLLLFLAVAGTSTRPLSLEANPSGFFLAATAATAAMGLQNAALRKVNHTGVHTTFVTGMLTELAVSGVRWWLSRRRGATEESREARSAATLAASVWSSYAAGALIGAYLVSRHGITTLAVPMLLLATLVWRLFRSSKNPLP
jgi:oxalate decarboxylase